MKLNLKVFIVILSLFILHIVSGHMHAQESTVQPKEWLLFSTYIQEIKNVVTKDQNTLESLTALVVLNEKLSKKLLPNSPCSTRAHITPKTLDHTETDSLLNSIESTIQELNGSIQEEINKEETNPINHSEHQEKLLAQLQEIMMQANLMLINEHQNGNPNDPENNSRWQMFKSLLPYIIGGVGITIVIGFLWKKAKDWFFDDEIKEEIDDLKKATVQMSKILHNMQPMISTFKRQNNALLAGSNAAIQGLAPVIQHVHEATNMSGDIVKLARVAAGLEQRITRLERQRP